MLGAEYHYSQAFRCRDNRYQYQSWYIKLWRRRWYLTIPIHAAMLILANPLEPFRLWWGVAVGLAQMKMKWYYSEDELWEDEE